MKTSRRKTAAIVAASTLALGAAISAPSVQAMDGNKSLASVLDVGNASFDRTMVITTS